MPGSWTLVHLRAMDSPHENVPVDRAAYRGRREQVNDLYRRGQIVHNTIKAHGVPGSVRIEVYENGQLVKHMQY